MKVASKPQNLGMPRTKSGFLRLNLIDQGGSETPEFGDASSEINGFDLETTTFSIVGRGFEPQAQAENIRVDY